MSAAVAALVLASIYGPGDSGGVGRTSSGARFNPTQLSCAHRDLPFGTRLILHHGSNSVEVVINDRGPWLKNRSLDCTPAVDRGLHLNGLGKVRVEPFPPLPRLRPEEK